MNSILVFARAPQPGQVKTRLAAHIGDEAAARLYAAMLKDTLQLAQDAAALCEARVIVAYTPDDAFEPGPYSLSEFWDGEKIPQIGDDLGERLCHAMNVEFKKGARHVVVIGSDMPNLPANWLAYAFTALDSCGAVMGNTSDGGFYLFGLRFRAFPQYFNDVLWSSDKTAIQVLKNLQRCHVNTNFVPQGFDLDEVGDLHRFQEYESLFRQHSRALHTLDVLNELQREKLL